jgi:threonine dehydrogenase-like Zn-dependent dehydrogenase
MTDVKKERLEKARLRGFDVIDPTSEDVVKKVKEMTDGKGADIVFDVAGVQSTATMSTQLVKIRGQIVIVAIFNNPPNFNFRDVSFKEFDVIGVRVYNFEDYDIAIDMVYNKRINIEGLATHIFDLEDGEKAFITMENGEGMKILFKINES